MFCVFFMLVFVWKFAFLFFLFIEFCVFCVSCFFLFWYCWMFWFVCRTFWNFHFHVSSVLVFVFFEFSVFLGCFGFVNVCCTSFLFWDLLVVFFDFCVSWTLWVFVWNLCFSVFDFLCSTLDVFKRCSKYIQDVFKTCSTHIQITFKDNQTY